MMPPFAYYGGKTVLADRIVAMLPSHRHYVEPYAGSLAVLLAKSPARMETVNDCNRRLMTFWRMLRDRPAELARVCALTPHSRAEYAACRQPAGDDLEAARRTWVLLTQGRAASLRKTGWRHFVNPAGSSTSLPGYLTAYVDRMAAVAGRLRSVSLECGDALRVIDRYGNHPDTLIYADPPYLPSTRTSDGYEHEMTEADHHALAEALHTVRAAVVLSGYPSDLYDRQLYRDWYRVEIPTGSGQGHEWAPRTEVLWANRPIGEQPSLFDLAEYDRAAVA
jgi:DNA adenine methylase